MASATALPDQGWGPTGLVAEADSDPGDVGDSPAGLLLPANGALTFGNAAQLDRFALPAVKAKDPIRLADRYPAQQLRRWTSQLLPFDIGGTALIHPLVWH